MFFDIRSSGLRGFIIRSYKRRFERNFQGLSRGLYGSFVWGAG